MESEVVYTLLVLKNGKASEKDNIHAEMNLDWKALSVI
jgi:hypothetical protein